MDGMCGAYSVINSVSHLAGRRVGSETLTEVFRALAKELNGEGLLHDLIVDGIKFQTLGKLVDIASAKIEAECGLRIKRRVACRTGKTTLDGFWELAQEHVDAFGPGSCILGLGGKHDHWTCVKSVGESSIRLIDSSRLHVIQRSRSTVGAANNGRHHELWPSQSYFLEMEQA